jgi:hypothetical protein
MCVNEVSPITEPRIPSGLEITFWIRSESAGEDKHLLSPLIPENMPGFAYSTVGESDSSRWERMVQTLSGRRGLVLSNVRDETREDDLRGTQVLRLVSCERHRAQATFRDLVLPDYIDLFSVHGLFLDDHLGIVSMIDSTGVLYSYSLCLRNTVSVCRHKIQML